MEPQGGSARIIDQYYEQYEQYDEEFPDQSRVRRQFAQTQEIIQRLFPSITDSPRWRNRADYYSLFVTMANSLKNYKLPLAAEKPLAERLLGFAKEVDKRLERPTAKTGGAAARYARAIEKGSNDKARRMDRHEALAEVIIPLLKKET